MTVEFIPGIISASGTLAKSKNGTRIVVTTRKAPTTNPCKTRMYLRRASSYKRKSKPSEAEQNARALFAKRQALVKELMKEKRFKTLKQAWDYVKQVIV